MATPVTHSGFTGAMTVGGVQIPIGKWSLAPTADKAETMNSMSGSIPVPEGTWIHYHVTFQLDINFASSPFSNAPNLAPGAQLTNIVLYLHQTARGNLDGLQVTATNGFMNTTPIDVDVKTNTITGGSMGMDLYGTVVLP